MKKRNKIVLVALGLIAVAGAASSCTANFCTNIEKSRIAYAIEPGVSEFIVSSERPAEETIKKEYGNNVYQVVITDDNGYTNSAQLNSIISSAKSAGIYVPSTEYFVEFDQIVFEKIVAASGLDLSSPDITTESIKTAYDENGYLKFYGVDNDDVFGQYKAINNSLRGGSLGYDKAAYVDFENYYITTISSAVEQFRSCITTVPGKYGNYGANQETSIKLEAVTWGEAWGKGGHVIEGLIVYPVAWLVDTFANAFAGPARDFSRGVPQLLALILVTVIVRLFIFLVTIKSTLSQQKMTALQPELAKIQQKYPNSNTNQAQKQRLAEEQMRLYKKNKVNPLSQLLVLIVQFPIFIGVWGAMQGSAVLATGAVFANETYAGLHLSDSIWTILRAGPAANVTGFWAAFGLIILMSVSQFISMKVPQWIQKRKTKKVARMGVNPAQKSQNRTANIISYVMLVMIIIMGFTLPAAMGVYWLIGAVVSLLQTLLTQYVFLGNKRNKNKAVKVKNAK